MNIMADMDRAGRFPSPRRIYAVLVLVAACLIAGCSLATAEQERGGAEKTMGAESTTGSETTERPNIILIVTDDLDTGSMSHMPNLRSLLIDRGTTFENAFVTDSLCCPSRASILLGQYLNDYQGTYVPAGWDEWYAVSGNYTSSDLNENGRIVSYDPGRYYLNSVLADKAVGYIRDPTGHVPSFLVPDRPFFMWLGTKAPHQPADPAPRYEDALPNVSLPRPPSFDEEDVSDKPDWISDNPPLGPEQIADAEDLYRKRLQSMLAVDDMIGQLVNALEESGELDNTYIFFTSDNGFHLGTHRLSIGKWTAYEEDIRVPLIVRGPGVP